MHQLGLISVRQITHPKMENRVPGKKRLLQPYRSLAWGLSKPVVLLSLPGQYFFTEHLHCTNIYIKYSGFGLLAYGKTVNMLFTAFFPSRYWMVFAHLAQLFSVSESAECFFPNGEVDESSTPCDLMTEYSSCCTSEDICLPNGLCFVTTKNTIRLQSCTDQDWGTSCPTDCFDRKRFFSLMRSIFKRFDMKI